MKIQFPLKIELESVNCMYSIIMMFLEQSFRLKESYSVYKLGVRTCTHPIYRKKSPKNIVKIELKNTYSSL